MENAIVVLNAGSSSIKFSLFALRGGDLVADVVGQIEGIFTSPRFAAKDASGRTVAEKSWGEGVKLGHDGAVEHLTLFLRESLATHRLIGAGDRKSVV